MYKHRFNTVSQASDLESYDAAEGSPHNYTNVEFAREKASGTPRRMKGTTSEESRWWVSLTVLLREWHPIVSRTCIDKLRESLVSGLWASPSHWKVVGCLARGLFPILKLCCIICNAILCGRGHTPLPLIPAHSWRNCSTIIICHLLKFNFPLGEHLEAFWNLVSYKHLSPSPFPPSPGIFQHAVPI